MPTSADQTATSRTTMRWFGAGIVAVAIALPVVIGFDGATTDSSVDDNVATGVAPDDDKPTEIDIHGIPTWWSGEPADPRRNGATELDLHGIPTWWSGEPAAHVHVRAGRAGS